MFLCQKFVSGEDEKQRYFDDEKQTLMKIKDALMMKKYALMMKKDALMMKN